MTKASDVVVVMVPFVAHGHLNQLLHLSRLISPYNIPVHFVCTATHGGQARLRLHGWNPSNPIHFHEVLDPAFTSPPPITNSTTAFPTHLQPSFNSSLQLRRPVADLIRSLSLTSRRVAVVHDALMAYVVQDVKSIPNAETYLFRPLSVFHFFSSYCEYLGRQLPFEPHMILRLPTSDGTFSQEFLEFLQLQESHLSNHVGSLYDSSRIIEGKFVEYLEKDEIYGKNHWAVGPFNPVEIQPDISDSGDKHMSLQWLDKQPTSSVIYVSFGTTGTLTDSQITELAVGLERSEQRFLWVLREADKGINVCEEPDGRTDKLPEGFEKRVEGRGLVVREWAPQLEILGHSSTGGFVSHCGWNSCMEAMTMGVAIAAWPLHSDQPCNAFLMADVLGVALVMRDYANRGELLSSVEVEMVVRKLMDMTEGEAIRKKAAEYGGLLRRSVAEGGVGRKELDSLVSHICRKQCSMMQSANKIS